MVASDGKLRKTDTLDTESIFRLIESIPSPKAEPFELWLASLGSERIDEIFDPEIAIKRAIGYYRNRGYSDNWIESRLKTILDRNKLTIDDVDKKYSICSNTIFVNNGNNDIESIKKISVNFLGHDKYEVITYDYPLAKYTLEHLKQLEVTNLVITKEPKISLFLNPGVDVEEIVNSKEWVKKYKR